MNADICTDTLTHTHTPQTSIACAGVLNVPNVLHTYLRQQVSFACKTEYCMASAYRALFSPCLFLACLSTCSALLCPRRESQTSMMKRCFETRQAIKTNENPQPPSNHVPFTMNNIPKIHKIKRSTCTASILQPFLHKSHPNPYNNDNLNKKKTNAKPIYRCTATCKYGRPCP